MAKPRLAIKIDIDTYAGMRDGVPALLRVLRARGVRASFFVAAGPDHSGRALRRIFRKGFLRKMMRTNAPALYGWRTMLYGTLLPGPQIGSSFASELRELDREHDLGVHGYDHVFWHDRLSRLGRDEVAAELWRGLIAFSEIMHRRPCSFAAPGWQCTELSLEAIDEAALQYHSDTRGTCPYLPLGSLGAFRTPEIPTTWPTLDELLGANLQGADALVNHLHAQLRDGLNVHTIHAEVEGTRYLHLFDDLLDRLTGEVEFVALADVASGLDLDALPRCRVVPGILEGRAGTVAMQEPL